MTVFQLFQRPFIKLYLDSSGLRYLVKSDKDYGTVKMIQIENEVGMLEDARDHSPLANSTFALFPWYETYGESIYTDEKFMATYYAKYIGRLASAARKYTDIPLYVNAALNSRGRKPGQYPSAGPLAHLAEIWKTEAPDIDFISPDIYDSGYKGWVSQYDFDGNPLFIPEIRFDRNSGVRALYAFGEHDAIGFSPFAIEDGSSESFDGLTNAYHLLSELSPYLISHRGDNSMRGVLFDKQDKSCEYIDGDIIIKASHFFTLPWDPRATDGSEWAEGGAIIIRLSPDEYLISGSGVVVEFKSLSEANYEKDEQPALGEDGFALVGSSQNTTHEHTLSTSNIERIGLSEVHQVKILPNGEIKEIREFSGDQTHQGRHVRISVGEYMTLRVRLYRYK